MQRSNLHHPPPAWLALALAALATHAAAHDRDKPTNPPAPMACASLAGQAMGGAVIGSAVAMPASATVAAHCKVSGLIAPKLNFELRLPQAWNRKLHYGGGGGYNGIIPPANEPAVNQGYAQVSSDSGHQGSPLDASFALNDPLAAELFGSQSVPTVMAAAREITQAFYRGRIQRSYFEGCSNGGREALIQAQRHPHLFDGIISRAPAYNWVGIMGAFNRTAKALAAPGGAFTQGKLDSLSKAVMQACDADDGLADGVVSHPRACHFNPAVLRCAGGTEGGDSCLSDAQLATLASWTDPASFGGGAYRNSGWPISGNENVPGAWSTWVTGATALQFLFQDTTVKNYLARDPAANSLTYDFDSNPAALARLEALNSAVNPHLHHFVGGGGKLILWHGTNDSALSYRSTLDYMRQVQRAMGGKHNTEQFLRTYLAPGVNHCAGGPGADTVDLLSALDRWVTRGKAPETLTASKLDPTTGATQLQRPLCVYPEVPRYKGKGDVNSASSFRCDAP